jgi:hypothetical protein
LIKGVERPLREKREGVYSKNRVYKNAMAKKKKLKGQCNENLLLG